MAKKIPRYLKVLLAIMLPCVLVLGVGFVALALYDAPPPDDSEYKAMVAPVPPETNAAVTLLKLKGLPKTTRSDFSELGGVLPSEKWDEFWNGDLINSEAQALVMTRNSEALALLSTAMKKPHIQFEQEYGGATGDGSALADPASFLETCKVACVSWQNIRGGKRVFQWDEALEHICFVKKYSAAENGTLLTFLVGEAAELRAIDFLLKNIESVNDRNLAEKITKRLDDNLLNMLDFKSVFRGEYLLIDMAICEQETLLKKNPTLRMRYMLNPNHTRTLALNIIKGAKEAIDRGDNSLGFAQRTGLSKMNKAEQFMFLAKPNGIGRTMLQMAYSDNYESIYMGVRDDMARMRLAVGAFALRAYWLDHGALPETLGALTPEYLKTVPLDVFGGKPIQYNRDTAVIYSAGSGLVYDDGAFAFGEKHKQKNNRSFLVLDWVKRDISDGSK